MLLIILWLTIFLARLLAARKSVPPFPIPLTFPVYEGTKAERETLNRRLR